MNGLISLSWRLALLLSLAPINSIFAHGGGIDGQGGHNDRTADNYHFHQGPLDGQTFDSKDEATAALLSLDGEPDDATDPAPPFEAEPADPTPYLPTGGNGPIIQHYAYTLQYSEEHEQASWVIYHVQQDRSWGLYERTDNFRTDASIETGSASLDDYSGSGYDRGHLAPAATMSWSQAAMSESFFMSNMSPQLPGFNRGIWRVLEAQVRNFAFQHGAIWVVTGPVLRGGLPQIGENEVTIPEYYYKVILDIEEPGISGIGFLLAHEASDAPLSSFAVPIDAIEAVTGLDFFSILEDDLEEAIESKGDLAHWFFSDVPPTSVESMSWGSVKGE